MDNRQRHEDKDADKDEDGGEDKTEGDEDGVITLRTRHRHNQTDFHHRTVDNGDEDEDRPVDRDADVSCNNVHSNRRNNSPETLVKLLPKMFGGTSRPLKAAAGPTR